jgi:hypothetical protein
VTVHALPRRDHSSVGRPTNYCGMAFGFLLIMELLPVDFLPLFPHLVQRLDLKLTM